jgi:hypothetical protein
MHPILTERDHNLLTNQINRITGLIYIHSPERIINETRINPFK